MERTLKQFVSTGNVQVKRRGIPGKAIDEQVRKKLLDPKTLKLWAPFSLRERQFLCSRQFNYRITYYALRKFYWDHGVKYKNTEWLYRTAQRNAKNLNEKRKAFAPVLARVIDQGKGPVYIGKCVSLC